MLFGPHTHNFVFMSELILEEKGGFRIADEKELYTFIKMLLKDLKLRSETGRNAKAFADKHKGALKEILKRIGEHVDKAA